MHNLEVAINKNMIIRDTEFGHVKIIGEVEGEIVFEGWCVAPENYVFGPCRFIVAYYNGKSLCANMIRTGCSDAGKKYGLSANAQIGFTLSVNNADTNVVPKDILLYGVCASGYLLPLSPRARWDGLEGTQIPDVLCQSLFERLANSSVSKKISPLDAMHNEYYDSVGQSGARCVIAAALQSGTSNFGTILDMPCGHGRVGRYLRILFPFSNLSFADIDHDGVDFCAKEFSGYPIHMPHDIRQVDFQQKFDIIWCGSMFTHFREATIRIWIEKLLSILSDGGIVVTTFHGRKHLELMKETYRQGWRSMTGEIGWDTYLEFERALINKTHAYADFDRSPQEMESIFPGNEYGLSVSSPTWVINMLQDYSQARVVSITEAGWAGHHDVLVFQKI